MNWTDGSSHTCCALHSVQSSAATFPFVSTVKWVLFAPSGMRTRQIDQVMPNLTAKLVGSPDSIAGVMLCLCHRCIVCMCVECARIDEMMYGHVPEEGPRQSAARFHRRSPQCAAHGPLTAVTIPISIYWSLLQFINSIIYAVYTLATG